MHRGLWGIVAGVQERGSQVMCFPIQIRSSTLAFLFKKRDGAFDNLSAESKMGGGSD